MIVVKSPDPEFPDQGAIRLPLVYTRAYLYNTTCVYVYRQLSLFRLYPYIYCFVLCPSRQTDRRRRARTLLIYYRRRRYCTHSR